MISLRNPNTQNTMNRQQLIEDYAQEILNGMDMKTMECFVYDTLCENLSSYSDEQLMEEIGEYNPELLEDNDTDVTQV